MYACIFCVSDVIYVCFFLPIFQTFFFLQHTVGFPFISHSFDKHPTGFPPLPRAGKFVDLPRSLSAAQFPFVRPHTVRIEILDDVLHVTFLCGQDSDVFCRFEAHTNNSFFPSRYGGQDTIACSPLANVTALLHVGR